MKDNMTAVEWLVQQICGEHTEAWQKEIQQAKEMEKRQIMQSYNDGKSAVIHIEQNKSLEEYYNETFKSE